MTIAQARSKASQLRKAGILVTLAQDKAACDAARPNRHPMSSNYVVKEAGTAIGQSAPRIWATLDEVKA